MKQYIQALSVLALATAVSSCADYNMEDFNIAKPESIAQYEYLNEREKEELKKSCDVIRGNIKMVEEKK